MENYALHSGHDLMILVSALSASKQHRPTVACWSGELPDYVSSVSIISLPQCFWLRLHASTFRFKIKIDKSLRLELGYATSHTGEIIKPRLYCTSPAVVVSLEDIQQLLRTRLFQCSAVMLLRSLIYRVTASWSRTMKAEVRFHAFLDLDVNDQLHASFAFC